MLGQCLLPPFSYVLVGEEARLYFLAADFFFGSTENDVKEVPHMGGAYL